MLIQHTETDELAVRRDASQVGGVAPARFPFGRVLSFGSGREDALVADGVGRRLLADDAGDMSAVTEWIGKGELATLDAVSLAAREIVVEICSVTIEQAVPATLALGAEVRMLGSDSRIDNGPHNTLARRRERFDSRIGLYRRDRAVDQRLDFEVRPNSIDTSYPS